MKKALVTIFAVLWLQQQVFSQLDSIYDQGNYRTFIVHLPVDYDADNSYPIVLNLHGINNTAAIQQSYSQFNAVSDTEQLIVVYPNAIGGSWELAGNSDVDFLMNLADTLREKYSANSCLFSTGMSMGGFMTYKLACTVAEELTAIAVVAGNLDAYTQANTVVPMGLPVMHFHGTADAIVSIYGTFGIPPVETTIAWWVSANDCNTESIVSNLPDINTSDNSTVVKETWQNGTNGSEVIYFRINNGGHTWPGAIPFAILGNTNQDINASEIIGAFFKGFCPESLGIKEYKKGEQLMIYPNPSDGKINIKSSMNEIKGRYRIIIYGQTGQVVFSENYDEKPAGLDVSFLYPGIYQVQVISSDDLSDLTKIVISNN